MEDIAPPHTALIVYEATFCECLDRFPRLQESMITEPRPKIRQQLFSEYTMNVHNIRWKLQGSLGNPICVFYNKF